MLLLLIEYVLNLGLDPRARVLVGFAQLAALGVVLRLILEHRSARDWMAQFVWAALILEELAVAGTIWGYAGLSLLWQALPPLQGAAAAVIVLMLAGILVQRSLPRRTHYHYTRPPEEARRRYRRRVRRR